jgi:heat shock protein HslJ
MRLLASVVSGTLILALLAACGSDGGSSGSGAPSLDGTNWRLTQVAGAAAQPGGLLGFDGGKVTGSTGCNLFSGSYEQDGSSLKITLGPVTLVGCPPPLDTQEQAVLAALTKTASFRQEQDALTLLDGSGQALLAYSRQVGAALVGPDWHVTGINNGKQAVSSTITGSVVTATFAADGSVTGSAGCNLYNATYTLDGTALKVSAPVSTRRFCDKPDGVMEQEAAFLAALEKSVKVEASPQGLTLRGADGETQLTLSETG